MTLVAASQASSLITGICAGNYTVTVTDQNGCTDSQTFTITEPAPLALTATITNLLCFGGQTPEKLYSMPQVVQLLISTVRITV